MQVLQFGQDCSLFMPHLPIMSGGADEEKVAEKHHDGRAEDDTLPEMSGELHRYGPEWRLSASSAIRTSSRVHAPKLTFHMHMCGKCRTYILKVCGGRA